MALAQLLIQEYYHHIAQLYHLVTGVKETYDSLLDKDPVNWETSFSNEIGRLAQSVGIRMKTRNENIFLYQELDYQVEERLCMLIQYMTISHTKMTSIESDY